MNLLRIELLKFFSLLLVIAACGPVAVKKTEDSTESKVVKSETLNDVIKQMEQLIAEAKTKGEDAIKFLADDLYLKASDASHNGDFKTSSFLFSYLNKLMPDDEFISKRYAVDLVRSDNLEMAMEVLQPLYVSAGKKDETIGLLLGGVYTALEKSIEARDIYKSLTAIFPKNEEACVFYAKSYAVEEKYEKASSILLDCSKKLPKSAVFPYYQGKIYLAAEKKNEAKKYFQQSLKIDPTYFQAALALGLLEEEKEAFEKAAKIYKKFLDANPENYTVLSRLVQIYFVLNKFKEVIPYTERQVALDPSDLNMKVKLGILYTDAQRFEDAKGVFREILISAPTSDKVLYYLGALYQQTDDTEDAIQFFSRIPEDSNLFHDGQIQIGRILQAKSLQPNFEQGGGLSRFEEFVQKGSQKGDDLMVELNLMLAITFDQLKYADKAIKLAQKIENSESLTEKQIYYLASLYEKQKLHQESYDLINKILIKNPDNADALNFLGYSYLERNIKLEEAYELISKAHELKPEDGYIVDSIGWYHFRKGDLEQALFYIKKAYNLVKDDAEILKHLALIYAAMNQNVEAKKYLTEALKICEEDQKEDLLRVYTELDAKPRLPASSTP